MPNISITGEVSGFKIPDSIDSRYNAHYVDVDIYGTLNFTNNVGVKGGYRSRDVGYLIKSDSGAFTLKGIYFGAVAALLSCARKHEGHEGHQGSPVYSSCPSCLRGSALVKRDAGGHELQQPPVRFLPASRPSCRNRTAAWCVPAPVL